MSTKRLRLRDLVPLKTRQYLVERGLLAVHYLWCPMLIKIGTSSSSFLREAVRQLCYEVVYYIEQHDKDRMSAGRLAAMGAAPDKYADPDLDAAVPLNQRISGQILPLLESVLQQEGIRHVVEIGSANSTILSYLASTYPAIDFLGIDFYMSPEVKALERANLQFMTGYALDILEAGQLRQPIDVVCFQFTGTLVLPKEFRRYFQAFQRLGIRYVVLNEPTRTGFPIRLHDARSQSDFMGGHTWRHDYPGLARAAGYEVVAFQSNHWSKLIEPRFNRVRFDTHLVQMVARLAARPDVETTPMTEEPACAR